MRCSVLFVFICTFHESFPIECLDRPIEFLYSTLYYYDQVLRTKPYLRRLLAQSVLLGLVGFWPPPGMVNASSTSGVGAGCSPAASMRRLPSPSECTSTAAEGAGSDVGSTGGRIPRSGSFSTPSAAHTKRGERSNSIGSSDGPTGPAVSGALAEARRRLALLGVSAQFAEYLTTPLLHSSAQSASSVSVPIDNLLSTLEAIQALSSRLFDSRYYFELLERVVHGT